MKIQTLVLTAVLSCSSLSVSLPVLQPPAAIAQTLSPAQKFKQIRQNMTKQQVLNLMGKPLTRATVNGFEEWQYNIGNARTAAFESVKFKGNVVVKIGGLAG